MNHLCFLTLIIIALAQLQKSPCYSFSSKGLETVEKARLGSTPPSCHSKCNECHPCFAVQVPTLPRVSHSLRPSSTPYLMDFYDMPGNRYSPYKPLAWKCLCNNHFFNP